MIQFSIFAISHRSMSLKIADPLSLSCTMFKADLVNFIQQLFDAYGEATFCG